MALDKFGIKEVADVKFFNVADVTSIDTDGTINFASGKSLSDAVLELDTLKVSTIEFTAEQSEARGGKGNAPLIIWDYGREVNVTLEDALLSMKALRLMFGDDGTGTVEINAEKYPGTYTVIGKTFARNFADGKDHLFTFYIPKAKIQSENTLTMEADGDPTVFNMSLRVLRGDNGKMMELIADTSALTSTSATEIWGGTSTVKYTLTYIAGDGSVSTYRLAKDANKPTTISAGTGYSWPTGATSGTVTGDETFVAVASAS